jgi:23S rRNA (uracil1939-C5)-methyltransferase
MDFVFHPGGLGLMKKGTWKEHVDVPRCLISNQRLNELLQEVRTHFPAPDAFNTFKKTGTFKHCVIRTPTGGASLSFVLNRESPARFEAEQQLRSFAEKSTAENVLITWTRARSSVSIGNDYSCLKGADMLEEQYGSYRYRFSVQGFFQNNHTMAEQLVLYVRRLLAENTSDRHFLLDLYGGVGTFGVACADLYSQVLTVEADKGCVAAAEKNILLNSCRNMNARLVDARELRRLELSAPLHVITDPPRAGMNPRTIGALRRLQPHTIIYVSCNLKQLETDLPHFPEYRIRSAALFDLFPQTPHCEGVLELVRQD